MHRTLAYVAGEPAGLALTGWECLQFLGRSHGPVDDARQVLIERFHFEPDKRVRDY
jgi:ABC-type multidrug transport system ATPase subunit